MHLRLKWKILVILLACGGVLNAQVKTHKFERFTKEEGISQSPVRNILQDPSGFLWVGTWNGLYQYDGYEFRGYWHDPQDSTTISHDWVDGFVIDRKGNFWVGTNGGGLNLFKPETGQFTAFRHDPNDPSSISSDQITAIFEDSRENLWIGTAKGLNLFDRTTGKSRRFLTGPSSGGLVGEDVRVIFEDSEGTIWIGTGNPYIGSNLGALNRYNQESGTFEAIYVKPEEPENWQNFVNAIMEDEAGNLLFSSWEGGLYKLADNSKIPVLLQDFSNFNTDHSRSLNRHFGITSMIAIDGGKQLWLGTYGGGLVTYDPKTRESTTQRFDRDDPFSIADDRIFEIFEDREGNIWVGTFSGLVKTDPQGKFTQYRLPSRFAEEWITSIDEDKNGKLWLGTSADHLFSWDPLTREFATYFPPQNDCNNWNFPGLAVAPSREDFLWVVTSCGIYRFFPTDGVFRRWKHPVDAIGELESDNPIRIVQQADGSIWLNTQPSPLHFGPGDALQVFRPDPSAPGMIPDPDIESILKDQEDNIWIASTSGLHQYHPADQTFSSPLSSREGYNHIVVVDIDAGENGELWLSTDSYGLVRYHPETKEFTNFTFKDGLHSNTLFAAIRDRHGYFWLLSRYGVTRFHPENKEARNFDQSDGLIEMQFSRHFVYRSENGHILLGGKGGFNRINPDQFQPSDRTPQLVLTELRINGVPRILENSKPDRNSTTYPELSLAHDENDLSLNFTGIYFSAPKQVRYKYKLIPYDQDWVGANTQRNARYTNLDQGNYTFLVSAANEAGVWSEDTKLLSFTVRPPWWQSWWAYILFGLLLLGILYLLRRYELSRIQLANELRMEKLEADKLKELDQTKSDFFANISHEFRTPLTIIMGQIEEARDQIRSQILQKGLNTAHRNAEKLLRLVNQLLDLSRLEAQKIKLSKTSHDIIPFLRNTLFSFESLARQVDIELHFHSSLSSCVLDYDVNQMEKVFDNLLSNAIKFTPEGGLVSMKISLAKEHQEEDDQFLIKIEDTGIGIPSEELDKVFDRFYQIDHPQHVGGTGIGLALTKELITLHGGSISVTSEKGKGTVFMVQLPLAASQEIKPGVDEVFVHSSDQVAGTARAVAETGVSSEKNKPLLLIVEDNEDVRAYMRQVLSSSYALLEAEDGKSGLKVAGETLPDLIISDIMMPHMDGYTFSRHIRSDERTSHIPLILLTAKAAEEDKIQGLEIGVDDYLTKPFSRKELLVRIDNLIQMRKRLRERYSTATVIRPTEVQATSLDQQFLEKVLQYIEQHLADPQLDVTKVAGSVNMSSSQLNRKLNALIDQPPGQLIRSMRLQRAADLIQQNAGTVAEICFQTGFTDQANFSRSFKKQFGVSPSQYGADARN